jgi:hypothetical protein
MRRCLAERLREWRKDAEADDERAAFEELAP